MPMVGQQIAAQVMAVGQAAQKAQLKAVNEASLLIKRRIEGKLDRAIGSDHRMSNLRKPGGTPPLFSLGFDVKGVNNPTALLKARGPWGLVEYGSEPHRITPRTGSMRSMSRRERLQSQYDKLFGASGVYAGLDPLPIGEDVFRYSANHPGTKGKYPFRKGLDEAMPDAIQRLNTVVLAGVANVWRQGRQTGAVFVSD